MSNYPALDEMSDLDLILLHHKVADSMEPTDIEFKNAIMAKLKERCITVTGRNDPGKINFQNIPVTDGGVKRDIASEVLSHLCVPKEYFGRMNK